MTGIIIVLWLGAFFLGAVPFGLILAKLRGGVDLRTQGSGNIGAANVTRTLGAKLGLLTLALDLGKGLVPVLAALALLGPTRPIIVAGAGLAAILGHLYSPFLGFKGGKGVATALGVLLALTPLAVIPALIVFVAVTAKWGYVSAGSLSAALVAPAAAFLLGYAPAYWGLGLCIAALVFLRHRENLGRLVRGQEKKWRKL